MTDAILEKLNDSQRQAVTWPHSPLLIIAGAGSGKTRILVHRIAWLIAGGVPAYQIFGVTFTNKAASEMKHRVMRLVDQEVWISTFHSACMKILRMEGAAIGLDRNFTIYDDSDQLVLIKECMAELKLNEKQIHPKAVLERIARAKDGLLTPAQVAEKAEDLFDEDVSKIYTQYEKKLQFLKACDFGDLIMKTVKLFDDVPPVLAAWQSRFRHVLIDEYQDTNHAQYRLVKQLGSSSRQVTAVGDPDQSIYSWRGADIQNILRFEKDYPDCGILKLERNYRSTATILDAANELIKHNGMRKPKNLWTDAGDGEKITVLEAWHERHEADLIVNHILAQRQQGRTLSQMVVFYRMHAQSRVLEDSLRRSQMPYKIIGGVRFYDRKEIKDLIAYLRIISNPSDDLSMKRILNVPARGIGKKSMETLEEAGRTRQLPLDAVLTEPGMLSSQSAKVQKALKEFKILITNLRNNEKDQTVQEIAEAVLKRSGYIQALQAEKTIEAQARLENLQEFFSVIQDFEERLGEKPLQGRLSEFLETISLVTDLDSWDASTDVLTLMTLHTAKGLEFPIVFMMGMEEGIFPNVNSYTDSIEELEEERRLCYVGITRAREKLFMSYARERRLYGNLQRNLVSRFITEIPAALIESSIKKNFVSEGETRYSLDEPPDDLWDDASEPEDRRTSGRDWESF